MKKLVLCMLSVLCGTMAFAQIHSEVTFASSQLQFSTLRSYDVVDIENLYGYTQEEGAPQLPVQTLSYVIPYDKMVAGISITGQSYSDLAGTYTVYPVQPPRVNGTADSMAFVQPSPGIYSTNTPYPYDGLIKIVGQEYRMGYHVVTIQVQPLQYFPQSRKLRLYTRLNFTLQYAPQVNIPAKVPQTESRYQFTRERVRSMVQNAADMDIMQHNTQLLASDQGTMQKMQGLPAAGCMVPEYIIITNNTDREGKNLAPSDSLRNMVQIFQKLADRKTRKGIPTVVITLDEIKSRYTGIDVQEQLRNYLTDVYKTWGNIYILLGGDINIIPERMANFVFLKDKNEKLHTRMAPTDVYYSSVSEEWNLNRNHLFYDDRGDINKDRPQAMPDFYMGRAPVENANEAETFIHKIEVYENMKLRNTLLDGNYIKNTLFMQHDETIGLSVYTYRYFPASFFKYILADSALQRSNDHVALIGSWDNDLTRENAIRMLNEGVNNKKFHWVCHEDHSSPWSLGTGWNHYGESLSNKDVSELSNAPYYQILYTGGCSPGDFSYNAVVEDYLKNPKGGGVAVMASSNIAVGDMRKCAVMIKEMYQTSPKTNYRILHAYYIADPQIFHKPHERYHLFGDPEMPVWTELPKALSVSTSPTAISNITTTFTVNVNKSSLVYDSSDITVCLYKDHEIYQVKTLSKSQCIGSVLAFNFSGIQARTAGTLYVTVTGHNYYPLEMQIPVSISGRNLKLNTVGIADHIIGNNNGKAESGETLNLNLGLDVNGTLPLINTTFSLLCESPYISLLSGSQYQANVNQGIFTLAPFPIKVSPQIPNTFAARNIAFKLLVQSTGYTDTCRFNIEVGVPEIGLGSASYSADGRLAITLYNSGTAEVRGLNITSPVGTSFGNIPVLGSQTATPLASFMPGASLTFAAQDYYGRQWQIPVSLTVPARLVDTLNYEGLPTSINLNWAFADTAQLKGYHVYKSTTAGGTFQKINTSLLGASLYTDYGLQPNTLYYYKVSWVNKQGIESGLSAVLEASTAPACMQGFPFNFTTSSIGGNITGSPCVYDIDGDGKKELFFGIRTASSGAFWKGPAAGGILALRPDGTEYRGKRSPVKGFANCRASVFGTPAIADVNGDGKPEIVVSTTTGSDPKFSRRIHIISTKDTTADGYYKILDTTDIGQVNINGVVLEDYNRDGIKDIFCPSLCHNGWRYYYDWVKYNKKTLRFVPSSSGFDLTNDPYSSASQMAAAADIDNDGRVEVVIGHPSGLYLLRQNNDSSYTRTVLYNTGCALPYLTNYRMDIPPVLADIDGDGAKEIIFATVYKDNMYVMAIKANGTLVSGWADKTKHLVKLPAAITTDREYYPYLAVADVDRDGKPEIITAGKDYLYAWKGNGDKLSENFPITIPSLDPGGYAPLIADLDGDEEQEILIASRPPKDGVGLEMGPGLVHAYKLNGQKVLGFPICVTIHGTPVLADIDNDGKTELIVGGEMVYVWKTKGDANRIEWGSFRGDAANTGTYQSNCMQVSGTLSISQNTTWDNIRIVTQHIVIPNGITLTIKNTLMMAEGAKITVRKGGTLNVEGGKITARCTGKPWQGIELEGDYNTNYTLAKTGILTLKNGAVIENAKVGVSTVNSTNGSYFRGGQIVANNAVFRNNEKSVYISPVTSPANTTAHTVTASFYNCTFELTSNFNSPSENYLVQLNCANGANFEGCIFQDMRSAKTTVYTGIYALYSKFKVNEYCTGPLFTSATCNGPRSQFKNLDFAINAADEWNSNNALTIANSDFNGNVRGIQLSGYQNAKVYLNNFNNTTLLCIYLLRCMGYHVEANTFNTSGYSGIVLENDHMGNEVLYRNTFINCYVGIEPIGQNKYYPWAYYDAWRINDGLQLQCNTFQNCSYGVYVHIRGIGQGIANLQGNSSLPAANSFTGNYYDILNYGDPIDYYSSAFIANHHPYPAYNTNHYISYNTNACPQKLVSESILIPWEPMMATQTQYETLVDGGNTETLATQVEVTLSKSNNTKTKETLQKNKGYLSDKVLLKVAKNENGFTPDEICDIMVNNPQATRSDNVMDALKKRNKPLNNVQMEKILKGKEVKSPREKLEITLSERIREVTTAIDNNIRILSHDTINRNNEIMEQLNIYDHPEYKYQLADMYLRQGDRKAYSEILKDLEKRIEDPQEKDYFYRLCALNDNVSKWKDKKMELHQLPDPEIKYLRDIVWNQTGRLQAKAIALLMLNGKMDYEYPFYFPEEREIAAKKMTYDTISQIETTQFEGIQFAVQPNPANEYVKLIYHIVTNCEQAEVVLYNHAGREAARVLLDCEGTGQSIAIGHLNTGLYYISLYIDGKMVKTEKLIIAR